MWVKPYKREFGSKKHLFFSLVFICVGCFGYTGLGLDSLRCYVVFNKIFESIKLGDVPVTYASIDFLKETVGFKPRTNIEEGLQKFADWYVNYYKVT